jgi:hypothetical protein
MFTIDTLTPPTRVQPLHQGHLLAGLVLLGAHLFLGPILLAQSEKSGFQQFKGAHIELITDVASSPELQELTAAFDAGVRHWTDLFHADASKVVDWKVKAFIMTERERFENAGLISATIRTFREGHQEGDLILCKEQPSAYYRRHLLLHEGVHWFMEKALGGYGPGWWMEGIAEWQSTHQWDGKNLVCGVMPRTREQFPYWGRLEWIEQDLVAGQAPSLPILFRRAKDLHRVDSTYGWSWLAATFFANHPRYKDQFFERLSRPTDQSDALNRDVLKWIGDDMQTVQSEFNGFVAELDYGVDPASIIVDLKSAQLQNDPNDSQDQLQIDSADHWRMYPRPLLANQIIEIAADGLVDLQWKSDTLETTPQGITLQYVRGHPLGQLIGSVIPRITSLENTIPWTPVAIGNRASLKPGADSWLLLRFNDDNATASNPSGAYRVTIQKDR